MSWGGGGGGGVTPLTPNKGFWNANTNSPDYVATLTQSGDFLITSTAGTQTITGLGSVSFTVGDYIVRTDSGFMHIDANDGSVDLSGIPDGTLIRVSGTTLGASSIVEDAINIDSSKTIRTEFSSIEIGPAVRLSEIGGEILIKSAATTNEYVPAVYPIAQPESLVDTDRVVYNKLQTQEDDFLIQSDNTIETAFSTFNYNPAFDNQANSLSFDFVNALTNFRARITTSSGARVIRYFPSERHWNQNTGITTTSGVVEIARKDVMSAGINQTPFRFFNNITYNIDVAADQPVVLRGSSTLPWIQADIQRITITSVADLTDLDQPRVSLTSNITITPSNLDTYNRAILFTPSTQTSELTITLQQGNTELQFFDLCVLGSGPVRVIAQGAERVNGETDIRFTNLEGGRIKQVENGFYSLIFDNTDPDMIDDYIDNARLDGNNLILENSNPSISNLSVDLSSLAAGALSLTNLTGSTIGSARPIVVTTNAQGTLTGTPATTALLDVKTVTGQRNRVYGFTTSEVTTGSNFIPLTSGVATFAVSPEPAAGTTVWARNLSNGNIELTTEDLSLEGNDVVYGIAGFVTTPNPTAGLIDVFLSADLLEKSRTDRLTTSFNGIVSHTASGVQNYGGDVSGKIHILAPSVTAFDLLILTDIRDRSWFSIVNRNSSEIEFDISAVSETFGGDGLGSPQAYNIPGNSTVIFYTIDGVIYPLSSTSMGGAAGASDHPVILTRDTPSLSQLNALALASLNDNSALWILASNQISATELNVDASIMIRALQQGLLDSGGVEISTTAVQKSTVTLAAGTVVRIFSSTDLRVVSTPSPGAMRQLYPDVPFSGSLEITDEGTYNSYLRRTATNAGGVTNEYIRMPSLNTVNRPSYVREGDVFVMRHTGTATGSQRPAFRVATTGDNIAGHGFSYFANPGQTIAIQAPRFGVRTWQLFPVAQMTDGNTYYSPEIILPNHFYVDDSGSIAADNSLRLHYDREIVDGLVRNHISQSNATSNPAQLWFQSRDIQDDISWIQYFSALGAAVPPLGTTVAEITDNVPTALTWIQNNVSDSFDFTVSDPSVTHSISYVTYQSVQTVKVGINTALPSHIVLNDVINISGNSFAGNNGDWAITQIYPDRLAFDITIPASSSANNTGASGLITRNLYGRSVLVADDIRVHTFNLYKNSARNNPVTNYLTDWYDITSESVPSFSLLSIGYNTDIQVTSSQLAVQDEAGDWFNVKGGPRKAIGFVDNRTTYTSSGLNLPVSFSRIHIDTLGINTFYIPEYPDQLTPGEARIYTIHSLQENGSNDVTISVGETGSGRIVTFDEGINAVDIPSGSVQQFELYNDGKGSGARLASPFEKLVPSFLVNTTPTAVTAGIQPMNNIEISVNETQDPNRRFQTITANKFVLKGAYKYTLQYNLDLIFNGSEDTGLSFVNIELVPTITRDGTTSDIRYSRGATTATLLFVRNGNDTDEDTKPRVGLNSEVTIISRANDEIGFDLRFGTFPAGYSISDITKQNVQYSLTVKGGLD